MKKTIVIIGTSLCLIILLMGCSKDQPIYDEEAPQITIASPNEGDYYEAGAMVLLKVDIQENLELHQYSAVLRSTTSEVAFTINSGHVHGKSFEIDQQFELPELSNQEYRITVKANDHDDNLQTETITIYTH